MGINQLIDASNQESQFENETQSLRSRFGPEIGEESNRILEHEIVEHGERYTRFAQYQKIGTPVIEGEDLAQEVYKDQVKKIAPPIYYFTQRQNGNGDFERHKRGAHSPINIKSHLRAQIRYKAGELRRFHKAKKRDARRTKHAGDEGSFVDHRSQAVGPRLNKEVDQQIKTCVETLNDNQKEALRRWIYDQQSYQEIAKAMGITVVAARSRIARAKKKLEECLNAKLTRDE